MVAWLLVLPGSMIDVVLVFSIAGGSTITDDGSDAAGALAALWVGSILLCRHVEVPVAAVAGLGAVGVRDDAGGVVHTAQTTRAGPAGSSG